MINIIVACARNRVIGKNGRLPWSIREDWEYFLEKTSCGTLIMGSRCYREMGKHLLDREVIALSRDPHRVFPHARKASSLPEALEMGRAKGDEIWICGGQAIYEEALPFAEMLYLTLIDQDFDGDVFFPPWEQHFPVELACRETIVDGVPVVFQVLTGSSGPSSPMQSYDVE
ncbi:MAG: dihydrofolate reductase [Opitutales bacterium]